MFDSRQSIFSAALLLGALFMVGCKEEQPVVYSERVAVLPDQSGLLNKEIREIDKTHTELVILETIGGKSKDILRVALSEFSDVRFRFKLASDTICLVHTQAGLEGAIQPLASPAFPIITERVTETEWLTGGLQEGDPLFYAQDKWGALVELVRK